MQVTLAGSSVDTLLYVYTGTAVNALTLVAVNFDCTPTTTASCVTFNVVPGTTYSIQVFGYWSSVLATSLAIAVTQTAVSAPSNDLFSTAVTTFPASGTTIGATLETGEPVIDGASGSVWYRFTAQEAAVLAMVRTVR